MPKKIDYHNELRNVAIAKRAIQGETFPALAKEIGLSKERTRQIVNGVLRISNRTAWYESDGSIKAVRDNAPFWLARLNERENQIKQKMVMTR